MLVISDHLQCHETVKDWVIKLVAQHRDTLEIESRWVIDVAVLCPQEGSEQALAGLVEWIPDTYQAKLSIRCDLPYSLVRWETIHELQELAWYRTGTAVSHFVSNCQEHCLGELSSLFMRHYRVARNQEVEQAVERYLGERRPQL